MRFSLLLEKGAICHNPQLKVLTEFFSNFNVLYLWSSEIKNRHTQSAILKINICPVDQKRNKIDGRISNMGARMAHLSEGKVVLTISSLYDSVVFVVLLV